MMNRAQITKMAKRILHAHEGVRNPQLMHPARDWVIGLIIAISFFAGVATWSTLTYIEYRDFSVHMEGGVAVDPVVYRESLVMASLEAFAARTQTYEELLATAMQETNIVVESNFEVFDPVATTTEATATTSTDALNEAVSAVDATSTATTSVEGE